MVNASTSNGSSGLSFVQIYGIVYCNLLFYIPCSFIRTFEVVNFVD